MWSDGVVIEDGRRIEIRLGMQYDNFVEAVHKDRYKVFDFENGFSEVAIGGIVVDKIEYNAVCCFNSKILIEIRLEMSEDNFSKVFGVAPQWGEDSEEIQFYRSIVESKCGVHPYVGEWGQVSAVWDERGGFSSIIFRGDPEINHESRAPPVSCHLRDHLTLMSQKCHMLGL